MERDKFPLLKLKLHTFSSANSKQQQDQQPLPVKDKKDRISPGPPTYASGLMTERNPNGGKIKPSKFFKRLDQANQFFKQKYDK